MLSEVYGKSLGFFLIVEKNGVSQEFPSFSRIFKKVWVRHKSGESLLYGIILEIFGEIITVK